MARPKANKHIVEMAMQHFEKLLKDGAFPEVEFETGDGFKKYNMMEFHTCSARFLKYLDDTLRSLMISVDGIFTAKRSKAFLESVSRVIRSIKEQDVMACNKRFTTMFD